MERCFEGKVALVTGATTGTGQASAVRPAAEGAVIVVNHLPAQDPAGTLERIGAAGGQGFGVPPICAIRNRSSRWCTPVAERGGRLDCVVSNAAINPFMAWDETSIEDFNNLFETNVRGLWVECTEGAQQMIREGHGGAICCVSSISAHVGAPGQTAYCGTKGASSMLAKALGSDLGTHGIRMNAVEPLGQDAHVRTDDGRTGCAEVLRRAGRAPSRRRVGGTCERYRLPALRRRRLRDLRDPARGRRFHRQRGAVGTAVAHREAPPREAGK